MNVNYEELIRKFHDKFQQTYKGPPRVLPEELQWRLDFIYEEFTELEEAVDHEDIVKTYDALLDLMVVCMGTIDLMGLSINKGLFEVMRSNMTKELGPIGTGKYGRGLQKGKDYQPPNLEVLCQVD